MSIKPLCIILFLTAAFLFNTGCSATRTVTGSVRFALTGNTSPDSPFSGFTQSFDTVIKEIENRKPQIIIHTGNAIYGGSVDDGILESDIRRQLKIFFTMLKMLNTAVYTVPGEKDYYNGSTGLYSEFSKKASCYSFNYGSIHFICLSSAESQKDPAGPKEIEWLKTDLEKYRDSSTIFVITYRQLFPEKKKSKPLEKSEELHSLFKQYNVRYVFSGEGKEYIIKTKDSVKYINAGCAGFSDKKESKKPSQFYIIDFNDNDIEIDPVRINLSGNFNKGKN